MFDHHPMCPQEPHSGHDDCQCDLLRDAEAHLRRQIATDLREQAVVANFAVRGRHPKVQIETHAAALRWAAARIEQP
jgi:hypothetical protein